MVAALTQDESDACAVDEVLTHEQGLAILDDKARRYLGVSGPEFVRRGYAGYYDGDPDRLEVMRVAMLLPLAVGPSRLNA